MFQIVFIEKIWELCLNKKKKNKHGTSRGISLSLIQLTIASNILRWWLSHQEKVLRSFPLLGARIATIYAFDSTNHTIHQFSNVQLGFSWDDLVLCRWRPRRIWTHEAVAVPSRPKWPAAGRCGRLGKQETWGDDWATQFLGHVTDHRINQLLGFCTLVQKCAKRFFCPS